jgi:hypothetical protein
MVFVWTGHTRVCGGCEVSDGFSRQAQYVKSLRTRVSSPNPPPKGRNECVAKPFLQLF